MARYRDYDEQYRYADRDFKINDRVVFVGPPPDEDQSFMISDASDHKLYKKTGRIAYGPTESLRCYPDEPPESQLGRMVWVIFDEDNQPIRQVDRGWLVRSLER